VYVCGLALSHSQSELTYSPTSITSFYPTLCSTGEVGLVDPSTFTELTMSGSKGGGVW